MTSASEVRGRIRKATEEWTRHHFIGIPDSIFEKLAKGDESILLYDSPDLRLVASPRIKCQYCGGNYEGDLSLNELSKAHTENKSVPCDYCTENKGDKWRIGEPEYAFPCGWGTLFAPEERLDIDWILEHQDEVAKLGFFVFESEDFGCLLGIDAGGFDFYEAFWIPLYKLRGLKWHELE